MDNASVRPSTVKALLVHPFFTTNVERARQLLNDKRLLNIKELEKWYDALSEKEKYREKFDQDSFKDLKEIVSSSLMC